MQVSRKNLSNPWRLIFCFAILLGGATGCAHSKIGMNKARLLDPMMDPAKTSGLYVTMRNEPMSLHERGSAAGGGAVGGSCPTCGG